MTLGGDPPDSDASTSRLPYRPALDGLRGAAVAAVLLYHSGFRWAKGGYLGVTTFFVLSGFLITGLLLRERDAAGSIGLRHFWGRRARRLVPGVVVLMAALVALVALGGLRYPPTLRGDAVAALGWVENWRFVFAHVGYAGSFAGTSPLQHLWSLGVEEQFYVLLPLVAVLALGRRAVPNRVRLGMVLGAALLGSVALGLVLYHSGGPIGRVYFGTDTRVAEPLVGALLALVLVARQGLRTARITWPVDVLGIGCLVGLVALIVRIGEQDPFLYRGGLLAAALLSGGVVVAATHTRGLVGRALAVPPLARLGRISYGVYLFHWPIFLWLTTRRTGLATWQLFGLRALVTIAVATVSYVAIEAPIRAGRLPARIGLVGWADVSVASIAALTVTAMSTPTFVNLFATSPTTPPRPPVIVSAEPSRAVATPASGAASTRAIGNALATTRPGSTHAQVLSAGAVSQPRVTAPKRRGDGAASLGGGGPGGKGATPSGPEAPPSNVDPSALRVVVVGDSLANNLANGLSNWAQGRSDVIVYNLAIGACPISRDGRRQLSDGSSFWIQADCGWWGDPQSQRISYFREFDPQVVVMEDGVNELPDRRLDSWSTWRHTGQPRFDSWLLNEYGTAISTFTQHGAKVLALNAVCADWEAIGGGWAGYANNSDGDSRTASLDRTTSALTAQGARVGDLFSNICPNGQFSETVDGVNDARPDGYHLTDQAALAVATQWLGPLVLSTRSTTAPAVP